MHVLNKHTLKTTTLEKNNKTEANKSNNNNNKNRPQNIRGTTCVNKAKVNNPRNRIQMRIKWMETESRENICFSQNPRLVCQPRHAKPSTIPSIQPFVHLFRYSMCVVVVFFLLMYFCIYLYLPNAEVAAAAATVAAAVSVYGYNCWKRLATTHCLHRTNVMLLQLEPLHFNLKTTQQLQEPLYNVLVRPRTYECLDTCAPMFTDM